jgi:hypothetical protein
MRMVKISWKYCRRCKILIRAKTKGRLKGKAAAFDIQFSLFRSTELGGIVPQPELRNFVQLILLYRFPFGLAESTFSEIGTAADAIMKSFISIDRRTKVDGITWPAFDRVLKETMVSEVYSIRTYLLTYLSIPHPRPCQPLLKLLSALIPHPET